MGAFFTNVQVHTGGRPPEEVRDAIARALRAHLAADGYEPAGADQPAERTVLVGPPGPEPWLAVFDQATESQRVEDLDALAAVLSKRVGTDCVGVLVHDEAVVLLRLFRRGRLTNYYNSWPDYFSPENARAAPQGGEPRRWRKLFGGGTTPAQWRAALALPMQEGSTCSQLLGAVGRAVGWHDHYSQTGYTYLVRGDEVEPTELESFLQLRFRPRNIDAQPVPTTPRFDGPAYPSVARLAVGDEIGDRVHVTATNVGASCRGIGVAVWGDAIRDDLLALTGVQLRYHPDPKTVLFPDEPVAPFETHVSSGKKVLAASFPEAEVAGSVLYPDDPGDPHVSVRVWVLGRPLTPGTAEMHVYVYPLQEPKAGVVATIPVTCGAR